MKSRSVVPVLTAVFLLAFLSVSYAETLTLAQGLKLALQSSKLLKIAHRSENIAESDTRIAKSYLLPKVDAGVSQTFLAYKPVALFGSLSAPMGNRSFLAYNVSVEQTLYDFRKDAARYEASQAMLQTTKLDTDRIRNLVEVNFAFQYFNLLESEKMVLVAGEEVDRLKSHLKDAKNLYNEGVITKNDLLQAEVRLSDAKQRLLAARNLKEVDVSNLNNAIDRPLTSAIQIEDIEEPVEVQGISLQKAWKVAEKDRPELRIIDDTLKSLNLQEVSKKAEYYPRIFVKGGYDFERNDYLVHDDNWSMVLGLRVNLFNGGKTTAEALKIEQQKEKLLEQRNKLVDDIRLEVEKYILDSQTARERLETTKDAIQQARENLRINRTKYEEGVGTATDVLDAVTLLSVAETNYYRAVYDLSKADAAILFSMGKELSEVYH